MSYAWPLYHLAKDLVPVISLLDIPAVGKFNCVELVISMKLVSCNCSIEDASLHTVSPP